MTNGEDMRVPRMMGGAPTKNGKDSLEDRSGRPKDAPLKDPKVRPGFLNCPKCSKEVKETNIEPHLRRVHKVPAPEAKAISDRLLGLEQKGPGKATMLSVAAMVIIALVLVVVVSYVTWFQGGGGDGSNGNSNKDYVSITFTTEDGWDLHGDLYTAAPGKPYLVLVHGMNENRKAYSTFIKEVRTKGYGVLAYDSRGFGESKVKNGTYTPSVTSAEVQKGTKDIKAAVTQLENRGMTGNGIILVGASVGANNVAIYAVNDTRITSIVLLSPGDDYQGIRPMGAIRSYTGAILFVAYEGDDIAYESCLRFYSNATKARAKNFFEKEGMLHGTGDLVKSDMRSKVEAWVYDNDGT